MGNFLLLDVSFGFFDILGMLLVSPIAIAVYVVLGIFLIYKGVMAIRRELAKKNGLPAEAAPMVESEMPETEPLSGAAAEAAGEPAGEEKPAPEAPKDEQ